MNRRDGGTLLHVIASAICVSTFLLAADKTPYRPQIPKAWVEAELEQMDVPVSQPAYSQKAVSPDYYYQIPVTPIYKSYPVYAPGRAPAGYMDKLKRLPPELAFDPVRLKTKEDWVRAGEIVFDAPAAYNSEVDMDEVASPAWYAATGV